VYTYASFLLFGGLMMLSALLVVTLPETNKAALKDTIEINERTPVISKKKDEKGLSNKAYQKDAYVFFSTNIIAEIILEVAMMQT
jgi:hypothetical protein